MVKQLLSSIEYYTIKAYNWDLFELFHYHDNLHVDQNSWKKRNQIVFQLTKDIKLRWFEYRIFHWILATNSHLFKIKITNTELCSLCNRNVETLTHLFWECIYVDELWNKLVELTSTCSTLNVDIYITVIDVIFGRIS